MMSALREMHEADFVHRDVKPDNFMIDNGVVKVIDFGLSSQYRKDGVHNTHQSMGGF